MILKLYTLVSSSTTTLYSPSSTCVSPVTDRTHRSAASDRSGPNAATTRLSIYPSASPSAARAGTGSRSELPSTHVSGIASGSLGGHTQLGASSSPE